MRGPIYSILSAVAFAMMAVLVKLGHLAGGTTADLLQLRFGMAVVILLTLLLWRDRSALRASRRTLLRTAFVGVFIYTAQSFFFFRALEDLPASTTALIFYFYPVAVTLLSAVVFRTRITGTVVLALLLVTSGCGLVFYDAFLKELSAAGMWYAFGAMAVFSVYLTVCQGLLRGEEPMRMTFYVLLFTAVGFNLALGPSFLTRLTPQLLGVGVALGVIPTAIAVSLLYKAIELIGSSRAAIFSTLEPVATLLAAHWLLGEEVVLLQGAGVALIVAGIALPNLRLRRKAADLGIST